MAPASGVRQAWQKDSCTYLNSLDSDNGMCHHCLDDVAHLPCCLHHPSGDVALQHWCPGVVSSRLWLGTAMGVGDGGDAAVAVGGGNGGWQR